MATVDISAKLAQYNKRLSRRKKNKKSANAVRLTKAEIYQKQLRTIENIRSRPTELDTAIENLKDRLADCDRSIKFHLAQIARIEEWKTAHSKHLDDYLRIRDDFDSEHSRIKAKYEGEKTAVTLENLEAVSAAMLELQNFMKANNMTQEDLKEIVGD